MEKHSVLRGIAASAGRVTAKACIVRDSADFARFSEGSVLVTKVTDPSMISVINRASAIVCDIGGITSHPSTTTLGVYRHDIAAQYLLLAHQKRIG